MATGQQINDRTTAAESAHALAVDFANHCPVQPIEPYRAVHGRKLRRRAARAFISVHLANRGALGERGVARDERGGSREWFQQSCHSPFPAEEATPSQRTPPGVRRGLSRQRGAAAAASSRVPPR